MVIPQSSALHTNAVVMTFEKHRDPKSVHAAVHCHARPDPGNGTQGLVKQSLYNVRLRSL